MYIANGYRDSCLGSTDDSSPPKKFLKNLETAVGLFTIQYYDRNTSGS